MTATILIIITGILTIYDLIVFLAEGEKATISYFLYTNAQKYPVIPFALGFLMGHLFWVQHLC